jgi:predicted RNA-binding protein with PIN domain
MATKYLIVDGHSIIFAWPRLRRLQAERPSLARDALIKQLRNYQDWTGVHVAVVFDGSRCQPTVLAEPHDVQIFYAARGQSADAIIERLASKYAKRFEINVATSDLLVKETVNASGAACVSPDRLAELLDSAGES